MSRPNENLSKSDTQAEESETSHPASPRSASYPRNMLDLRELIGALRRQLWLVAATVVLGMGLAIAYLLFATPEYSAIAQLLIDTRGQKILEADQVSPALDSEIGTLESQVEILRSRRIAQLVYEAGAGSVAGSTTKASTSTAEEEKLRAFMRRMNVDRVGLSYIIDVSFRDKDPNVAAETANKLVDAYVADQLAVKVRATQDAVEWLRSRFEKASEELRAAELRAQQFRSENDLVNGVETQAAGQREIADETERLAETQDKLAKAETTLHQMQQLTATPEQIGASGTDPRIAKAIAELAGQKTAAERRLAAMLSQGDETDPAIRELRAELETVERGLHEEVDRLELVARNDVSAARKEVERLEDRIKELKAEYAERDLKALELAELERKADAARELYTSVLKRLKETEAQETLQTPDARVIAYAAPPLDPSNPKKRLILVLALFGSAMIGFGAALARETLSRSRKTA